MRYRTLGRTGLKVSEIGFGAWGIGGKLWADSSDKDSREALAKAIECGCTFIDTALAYGEGHSERLVGEVLARHKNVTVASKAPPKNRVWPAAPGVIIDRVFPRNWIVSCTERSLKNLGVETLDLQQLHVWSPEWLDRDDWKEAAAQLKREGKIRFFGLSVNDHEPESVVGAVLTGLVDAVQVIYNIFDQSPAEGLFQLCQKMNIGVIARCPFDEGSLAGAIHPDTTFPAGDFRNSYFRGDRRRLVWERVQKIQPVVAGHCATTAEAALRFCLSEEAVSTVIPGMRRARYAEQNCAASGLGPLPAAVLRDLREHRWNRNFYSGA